MDRKFQQHWDAEWSDLFGAFDETNTMHQKVRANWTKDNEPRRVSSHVSHSAGSSYRQGQALRRIQKC